MWRARGDKWREARNASFDWLAVNRDDDIADAQARAARTHVGDPRDDELLLDEASGGTDGHGAEVRAQCRAADDDVGVVNMRRETCDGLIVLERIARMLELGEGRTKLLIPVFADERLVWIEESDGAPDPRAGENAIADRGISRSPLGTRRRPEGLECFHRAGGRLRYRHVDVCAATHVHPIRLAGAGAPPTHDITADRHHRTGESVVHQSALSENRRKRIGVEQILRPNGQLAHHGRDGQFIRAAVRRVGDAHGICREQ